MAQEENPLIAQRIERLISKQDVGGSSPSERAKMLGWFMRRDEMIEWLIKEKRFNPKAAPKCIDNFLDSLWFCLETTGSLPK